MTTSALNALVKVLEEIATFSVALDVCQMNGLPLRMIDTNPLYDTIEELAKEQQWEDEEFDEVFARVLAGLREPE